MFFDYSYFQTPKPVYTMSDRINKIIRYI